MTAPLVLIIEQQERMLKKLTTIERHLDIKLPLRLGKVETSGELGLPPPPSGFEEIGERKKKLIPKTTEELFGKEFVPVRKVPEKKKLTIEDEKVLENFLDWLYGQGYEIVKKRQERLNKADDLDEFLMTKELFPARPGEYKPSIAENGSYFGEISKNTGRPKTVHIKGYYRKDGTYVRGHYRSKPNE